jgi:hypothetical protein
MVPRFVNSYRAFKRPWVGRPTLQPDIRALATYTMDSVWTIIYVSWNGDTRTSKWRFIEVDSNGNNLPLGLIERQGFETRFEYNGVAHRVLAEAVDVSGDTIGTSNVEITKWPDQLLDSLRGPGAIQLFESPIEFHEVVDQRPATYSASIKASGQTYERFSVVIVGSVSLGTALWGVLRFYKRRRGRLFGRVYRL